MLTGQLMAEPKRGRGGRKPPPQQPDDAGEPGEKPGGLGGVTAVKSYERQRDVVAQVAAMLGLNQQDTMLRYLDVMEEDLLHLVTRRQKELQQKRADPPADQ